MTPPYPPLRARRTHDPSVPSVPSHGRTGRTPIGRTRAGRPPSVWLPAGARRARRALVAAGSAVALGLLGMAGSAASAQTAPPPPEALTTTASGIPRYDHVVVLMEENKFYDDIVGSKDAPYINSLAKQGASFSDFHGTTHPSQGNYVALYSGSTHGVADDDCPHDFSADNLGHQLIGGGHTFTGYSEDLPAAGSKDCGDDGDSGYARKHNGWVDFANTPASSNLGFDRFPSDYGKLPTVSFVTPNLDNDMHDGSVKQGDSWLKKNLDGYVQWARTHNSALMLTWDEDDGDDSDNQIATMIVGDHVKPGTKSKARYDHYSLLRTLEDMYGLPPLEKAASAKPVTDIWDTGVTPPQGGTDLALKRPVKTSSVESSSLSGDKAVDGSATTRWASKEGSDPQWISVDLGASTDIGRVRLEWEDAYGKAYTIQTSDDGTAWKTVSSTTSGDGGTDDLTLSGHGRYVRMYGTKRGTSYGYSLYGFEVYGADPAAVPTGRAAGTRKGENTSTAADLTDPHKKEAAMELVSSAENSSLDWKAQYTYVGDIGDGRGYTGGIVGFSSGTGAMRDLVQLYTEREPHNPLAAYLPALRTADGGDSHAGLGAGFVSAWHTAAADPVFQRAQNDERDRVYFTPSVDRAKQDGLHALGQFMYYDAMVMHGPGTDPAGFGGIRAMAMKHARPPAQGGDERTYLHAFLDARKAAMRTGTGYDDTSRVDTEQRVFLAAGNLGLTPPLSWKTYGDPYTITR
ncbi:chitosanase [Streptomyces sp. NPDC059398]|uniref:chitosanase n=1 Tax=Streptomyces sp. NPDC059398 TaxID=3346820 RepID=UPI0036B03E4E